MNVTSAAFLDDLFCRSSPSTALSEPYHEARGWAKEESWVSTVIKSYTPNLQHLQTLDVQVAAGSDSTARLLKPKGISGFSKAFVGGDVRGLGFYGF